jgi:hypothetical protein
MSDAEWGCVFMFLGSFTIGFLFGRFLFPARKSPWRDRDWYVD